MSEIKFEIEIRDNMVFLSGRCIPEDELTVLVKQGLKYGALKERFNSIQGEVRV